MLKKILFPLIFIYTFLGFFLLPYILKSQLIQNVHQQTNAKINIDSIYFNPYTFRLRVRGIELLDAKSEKLFSLDILETNIEPHSLFLSSIHIEDIKFQKPIIFMLLDENKNLNFNNLLKEIKNEEVKEEQESTTLPRIIIDKISITNGDIFYKDYSKKSKFETSLKNLRFELKNIDTKNMMKSDIKVKLSFGLNGKGLLKVDTNILSLNPLKLDGKVSIESAELYTEYKYLQDELNIELANGELSVDTDFFVNLDELDKTKIDNLNLSITKLRLKPKKKHKDILNLKSFEIKDATIYPLANSVSIDKIILDNLQVKSQMDKTGVIDWVGYIETNFTNENEQNISKETNKSNPWNISIEAVSLKNIAFDFKDASVVPSVLTRVNNFNLDMKNVTLLGEKPFSYEMQFLMNEAMECSSKGSIKHKVLDISSDIKCNGFDIVHYKAYIKRYTKQNYKRFNLDLRSALLGFDANIKVKDENSTIFTYINDANIHLDKFKLNRKSNGERIVGLNNLTIKNISLDTKEKNIKIDKTNLKYLDIRTRRYRDSSLNIDNLVVAKTIKKRVSKRSKQKEKTKDYRVQLDKFLLQNAKVSFKDGTIKPILKTKLTRVNLNLSNIDSKNLKWMKYNFKAKLNNAGYIKSQGILKHSPLVQKGKFELKNIRLKDFSPYIEQKAFIKLDDGILNLKTNLSYANSKIKPDLKSNGSLKLDYLFFNDSRDNSTLFALNHLDIKSFTYKLFPNRLFVDKININSFYVNAIVNKDKSMNFSHLMKTNPMAIASDEMNISNKSEEKFPIWILETNVKNGNAGFADYSLPIDFHTEIHDLNGMLYALSSLAQDTSYIDIDGEVDAYGSTKLKGSINTGDIKKYTDISFNFRNLDLNSISGYSATFAGHEIDEGKLFLDLVYDIKDSKLNSSNSIIVKNIKLGDEYKDENITSLPLGFVISLLEDSDGIIDIEMPIEGDVDDPNFKYGTLVMETFFKLIGNAVTSPFRFLGAMMGIDGDKLSSIEYKVGKSRLIPSEREKLDNLAKIMIKKPKISISLGGIYDAKADKRELQKQKLIDVVVLKSEIENRKNHVSAMTIDLLKDICGDIKDEVKDSYKDKAILKKEYKNLLFKKCINMQVVTDNELRTLGYKRMRTIINYLVNNKNIKRSRFNIKDIVIENSLEAEFIKLKLEIEAK